MKPAAYTTFSLSVHVPDDFTAEQLEAVRRRLSHYDLSGILHDAATAAAMAIDGGVAVQDIDVAALQERLRKDGQILEWVASVQP